MRVLGGFVLGLAFASWIFSLTGCAVRPKTGLCDIPPEEHEGYVLRRCDSDPDIPGHAFCLYTKGQQFRVVETKDCGKWDVVISGVGP